MKNKLVLFAVFTVASIVLLTGCIIVNVEKGESSPVVVAHGAPVKASATNSVSSTATNNIPQ